MPLVQVGSFAVSQSRSDNSRILSEADIARLRRCGYLNTPPLSSGRSWRNWKQWPCSWIPPTSLQTSSH
ncbi:hypothetical protein AWB81_06776 [Caballeronia arationis]|jgi:hypothetical protein|nr:hypothetical protein AWB81_06776 [Caballeronia arationis]